MQALASPVTCIKPRWSRWRVGWARAWQMIDRTYGRLAAGADVWEQELLDGFDERSRSTNGRYLGAENEEMETS
jgi:hypothetical protein